MTGGLPGASPGTGSAFSSPFGAAAASPQRPRGIPPLPLLTLINFFNYLDRQIVYGMTPFIGETFKLSFAQLWPRPR